MVDPGTAANVIQAALAVKRLFGGGGGQAYATGWRVQGRATPAGFTGLLGATGVGGDGAPYLDTEGPKPGELQYLNTQALPSLYSEFFGSVPEGRRPDVPLDITTEYDFSKVYAQVRQAFARMAEAIAAPAPLLTSPTMPDANILPPSASALSTSAGPVQAGTPAGAVPVGGIAPSSSAPSVIAIPGGGSIDSTTLLLLVAIVAALAFARQG